jgi:hypothetical protein
VSLGCEPLVPLVRLPERSMSADDSISKMVTEDVAKTVTKVGERLVRGGLRWLLANPQAGLSTVLTGVAAAVAVATSSAVAGVAAVSLLLASLLALAVKLGRRRAPATATTAGTIGSGAASVDSRPDRFATYLGLLDRVGRTVDNISQSVGAPTEHELLRCVITEVQPCMSAALHGECRLLIITRAEPAEILAPIYSDVGLQLPAGGIIELKCFTAPGGELRPQAIAALIDDHQDAEALGVLGFKQIAGHGLVVPGAESKVAAVIAVGQGAEPFGEPERLLVSILSSAIGRFMRTDAIHVTDRRDANTKPVNGAPDGATP